MDRTVESLYQFAVDYIKAATSIDLVIRGHENGVQPKGVYASVLLIGQSREGIDARVFSITDPEQDPVEDLSVIASGSVLANFSVQFYRTGASESARKFEQYKRTIAGREFLYRQGVVHRSSSDIRQLDYEQGQRWIERVGFDMTIAASSEFLEHYKTISEVDFTINSKESYNVTNEQGG